MIYICRYLTKFDVFLGEFVSVQNQRREIESRHLGQGARSGCELVQRNHCLNANTPLVPRHVVALSKIYQDSEEHVQ